ncbi:MAG TPA: putative quinol monooxygenase [Syntrophales bacterium]|nr:putative quinol monooxygenase [Syntrophales bacterium]
MIVIAKMKAQKGKEEDLQKAVLEAIPHVEQEAGTLVYTFNRSLSDPTEFVFYEKYTDKDALKTHSSTNHFKKMLTDLGPCLDCAPEILMYEEIGTVKK